MEIGQMSAWQLMIKGGPLMAPIVVCSLVALAIFIEKFFYFSFISTNIMELQNKIFELVKQNKLKEAMVICEQNNSPVAKIMKVGIVKYGASPADIKMAMEGVGLCEIPKLEKRTGHNSPGLIPPTET